MSDKEVPAPPAHEPVCTHDEHQPMSMCTVCRDDPRLAAWRGGWSLHIAWLRRQASMERDERKSAEMTRRADYYENWRPLSPPSPPAVGQENQE